MIRFDTFGRTAVFGAIAALCWLPWAVVAAPAIGASQSRAIYLITVLALYVAGLSRVATRRLALAAFAVVAGMIFNAFAHTTTELVLLLCVGLGLARSASLYPTTVAHAVVTEGLLLAFGLVFARFVGGIAIAPMSGAIWAFFLIQAFFFLTIPAVRGAGKATDPFDDAYRAAMRLLEKCEG